MLTGYAAKVKGLGGVKRESRQPLIYLKLRGRYGRHFQLGRKMMKK
jgi:hypothetical protein